MVEVLLICEVPIWCLCGACVVNWSLSFLTSRFGCQIFWSNTTLLDPSGGNCKWKDYEPSSVLLFNGECTNNRHFVLCGV